METLSEFPKDGIGAEDLSLTASKALDAVRRKENMLKAIALSSSELISNPDIFDAIDKSLPIIGKSVDVDRVYLFRNRFSEDDKAVSSQILEWNSGSSLPQIDNPELQNMQLEHIEGFLDELLQKRSFIAKLSDLPAGSILKNIFETEDVKSILIIPIFIRDLFWGYLGFDDCKYERAWADDEISILKNFSNTISLAIDRAGITVDLENMALFPQENPDPLFRLDLKGNLILMNKAAEAINIFRYKGIEYSFEGFAGKIASTISDDCTQKDFEVEANGKFYMISSLLSRNKIHINNYANNITVLKRTQAQLERLSLVASNNRQGVYFNGPDFKINYVNSALLELTGYEEAEILGKTSRELFYGPSTHPDSIKKLEYKSLISGQTNADLILYRKDRTTFWANVKEQPILNKDNETEEFFSIIEDISEKKLSEENLKNSESMLASLVDNLKAGILLEAGNGQLLITNNSFCSMFNIPNSPSAMVGSDCRELLGRMEYLFSNPFDAIRRIDKLTSEKKMVLSEEVILVNGQYFERDYIPLSLGDTFKGHLWKYTDITERIYQEKTLKQQEEKYRNIIANMKMALIETDNDDIIHYVNQQFCEMSGYSAEEIIGKKSVDLLQADESKLILTDKNKLRLEGISDTYLIQLKTKSGEKRWWLTSGGPNFNDKGKLIGTVGISVDITEQKILEEELLIAREKAEQSSNAKEAFLSNMSHEIRTPLNAIIGMIREISRESLSAKQNVYVQNASLASHHLLSIVNNILDITKIESGQINLDMRPFNLSSLIKDAISILSVSAQEKMLKLTAGISHMLAPAYIGDSNRISQILLNTLSNAIKFTDQGSIVLECMVTGTGNNFHDLRLQVTDTGIGIDESFLRSIFEKFSMGDFTPARKHGGSGLGMSITYQLVQLMNGTIDVKSTKGSGTTFVIDLRLEIGNEKEIDITTNTEIFDGLSNKKILLVEDNDLNRLVATNSLSYHHMKVTEAKNGIEAIERLKENSFDLILMDLQMPEMGGLDATRIIREEMKLLTPIIALTANAFKAEIERCISAGMNDYIIKPFEENTLVGAILKNIIMSEKTSGAGNSTEIPEAAPKLYDLEAIIKMSRGNKEFISKIVRIFVDDTPIAVAQIRKAMDEGDFNTLRSVAHRIKPNIENFGVTTLSQDIRSIETLAAEGIATSELESRIVNLEKIIKTVVESLAAEYFS